ncbi:MAG TPA: HD domain-containing phosphohydrolase [Longimicrobiales bacterium]
MAAELRDARILIVDDEPANVLLLERILKRDGYLQVRSTTDARRALPMFQEFAPDLVLLDLRMPHMDGFAVMEQLRPRVPMDAYLPILVLTADITPMAKEKALSGGARDFLTKPLDATEVLLRIRNLLETRFLHLELHGEKRALEEKVAERTRELDLTRLEILERLARAAEYRDFDTGKHAARMGEIAGMLATALGLSADRVELIRQAAPLHDIGKIGIPDAILLKPSPLTEEEFEIIKKHTIIGAGMLSGSRSPLLQVAEEIALYHHERWDGTGYAYLVGAQTPIAARIATVADVFDALSHDRPYRPAWPAERVMAHVQEGAGSAFDPDVVAAFLRIAPDIPLAAEQVGEDAATLASAAQALTSGAPFMPAI